jgi:hypothetical protein
LPPITKPPSTSLPPAWTIGNPYERFHLRYRKGLADEGPRNLRSFERSRIYFNGTFRWITGDTTHGEANPLFNNTSSHTDIQSLDSRIGRSFGLGSKMEMTPYFGIGIRHWTRDSSALPQGGYLENYRHSYLGGGVLLQFSPANRWVFSGYGFGGTTFDSHLDIPNYPVPQVIPRAFTFTLGNDTMWMAGASLDQAIARHWHLNGGADWAHFNYGQSASAVGVVPVAPGVVRLISVLEPDSRTLNMTVKAGLGFSF